MGTRGTPELRAREAEEAARLLRVSVRRNLDLGDGRLEPSAAAKTKVAEVIRELKPRIVFTNYPENNHPDHTAAGPLVAEATYLAGLAKLEASGEPHRPNRVLYYLVPHKVAPSFIVDVSPFHEKKMTAVRAYASQLFAPGGADPQTFVSQPGFLSRVDARPLLRRYHRRRFRRRRSISGRRCESTTRKFFDSAFTRLPSEDRTSAIPATGEAVSWPRSSPWGSPIAGTPSIS
jgi:bacillithiol biosynthesis deacetylase BshB1